MTNHYSEDEFILHYYGESGDPVEISRHLSACTECRAVYRRLQLVLNAAAAVEVPEPPLELAERVWSDLRPQLPPPSRWQWLRMRARRWAPAGAMAAIGLVAFWAGRVSLPPQRPAPSQALVSPAARERILVAAIGDHLDRSQRMLAELINSRAERPEDLEFERQAAELLLLSNRLYRQTADAAGDRRVAELLESLERVLVELVHLRDSHSGEPGSDVSLIREQVERNGLLFQLRVVGEQLRQQQDRPLRRDTAGGAAEL